MTKFKLVTPDITHKDAAIELIHEYIDNHAPVCGTSSLASYRDNYERWLEIIEAERTRELSDEGVPTETFFFIGKEPDAPEDIVGVCSVSYELNAELWAKRSHLSYSIRPTERGFRYAKIMLYALMRVCDQHGMEAVVLTCDEKNDAAWRTIRKLGGKRLASYCDPQRDKWVQKYVLSVSDVIGTYQWVYDPLLEPDFRNSFRKK